MNQGENVLHSIPRCIMHFKKQFKNIWAISMFFKKKKPFFGFNLLFLIATLPFSLFFPISLLLINNLATIIFFQGKLDVPGGLLYMSPFYKSSYIWFNFLVSTFTNFSVFVHLYFPFSQSAILLPYCLLVEKQVTILLLIKIPILQNPKKVGVGFNGS